MNDSRLFSSEIVRKEIEEMYKLYESLTGRVGFFEMLSIDEKKQMAEDLDRLIQMQEILYTRVFLSDDEDSQMVKDNFRATAKQLGIPAHMLSPEVFKIARESISNLKEHLEGLDTP
jgi:hypothetical protein